MPSQTEARDRFASALRAQPVLHASRFVLRRPVDTDIPGIVAIAGDWELAARLARMPHPYGEAHARFFLDEVVSAELTWAIVDRALEELVGIIGLCPCTGHPGSVELGYYVARQHWGRGVATEAGSAVVAYAIGLFSRDCLRSGYFADNPASGRVLEKLGFIAVGEADRPCLAAGGSKRSIEVALAEHG